MLILVINSFGPANGESTFICLHQKPMNGGSLFLSVLSFSGLLLMRVASHYGNYQAKSLSLHQCTACILQKWKIFFCVWQIIKDSLSENCLWTEIAKRSLMKVTMIQTVVFARRRKLWFWWQWCWQTFMSVSTKCFLIPPTVSPQHLKLTWAGESTLPIYLAGIVLRLITTYDLKATSMTVPREKQQAATLPSASLYLSLLAEVDCLSVLSFLEGQPAQQQHDAGTKWLVRKRLQSTQQ